MSNLLAILFIIFFSALIQSTFSFGGALVALPLLALFMDVRFATALVTMLAGSTAIVIISKNWRDINYQNAWRLIVSACIGIPFGILFLSKVDGIFVKVILAITVLVFTTLNLIRIKQIEISDNYAFGFGFISGIFGGAYNMGGPPVVMYGSLADWSPDQFRVTIQSYALLTNIFAIVGHVLVGNVTIQVGRYDLYSLPIVALTIWIGNYIHKVTTREQYSKYVKILLIILGMNLLVLTLWQYFTAT